MTAPEPVDAARVRVWHVGQVEAAPGGMSQVIRSYLASSLFASAQHGIASHTDASWPRRIRVFLSAVRAVATGPDPARDVVVVHLSEGGSFVREGLLLRLAAHRGVPCVAQLHGSRFVDFAAKRPRLTGWVLRGSRRTLALNEDAARTARALAKRVPAVVLPNAVEAADEREKEPLVVFGGEVGLRKGADILVRAWRRLPDRRGHRLVFAGPVAQPEVVDADAPDVEYLGAISHEELLALLDRSRVACLPSHFEGLPMFVLEALGRWNCVISTDVGGTPAALSDGAGILVPAGDEDALLGALEHSLTDAVASTYARRGHARIVERFSREVVFPAVEAQWLASRTHDVDTFI